MEEKTYFNGLQKAHQIVTEEFKLLRLKHDKETIFEKQQELFLRADQCFEIGNRIFEEMMK